jgi:hypothetical protein
MSVNKKYYPTLAEIINTNKIPDNLEFIENLINSKLEYLFYKNLVVSKSASKDSYGYSLDILIRQDLEIARDVDNHWRVMEYLAKDNEDAFLHY